MTTHATRVAAQGEARATARRSADDRPLRGLTEHELDAIDQVSQTTLLNAEVSSAFIVLGNLARHERRFREADRLKAIRAAG